MNANQWPRVKISDVCELIVDCVNKTAPSVDYKTPYKMIRTPNIKNGKIDLKNCRYVEKETFQKWTRRATVDKGDVLLTREAPMGEAGLVNFEDNVFLGQRIMQYRANPKRLDSNYLLYAFLSPDLQYQFRKHNNTGSIVSHIRVPDCSDFEINTPPLNIQRKVSKVLRNIDDKIELNNRINSELENMAKALYNYWFVQFDFPNTKGKPYKTSGGKMVYNAILKRKIPEGWKVFELAEIIYRSGTGLNPRENFVLGVGKNYYVTIKNMRAGKIILDNKCDKINDEALEIIDRRSQLRIGDILFTSIEPVGETYLIHEKPTNWNINESIFTLRPNDEITTSEHLYLLLSSIEMKLFTKNSSTGSVHKGIRHGTLKSFKLPYMNKMLIDEFSFIVKPLLEKIHLNNKENQSMESLRDWLLPMLMNGQVMVK